MKILQNICFVLLLAIFSSTYAGEGGVFIDTSILVNERVIPNSGKELNSETYSSGDFERLQENKGCSNDARGPKLVKLNSRLFESRYFEVGKCTLRSIHISKDTLYIIDDEIGSTGIKQVRWVYHFNETAVNEILTLLNLHEEVYIPKGSRFYEAAYNSVFGGKVETDAGAGGFTGIEMMVFDSTWNESFFRLNHANDDGSDRSHYLI
jgi:hypothetical protein